MCLEWLDPFFTASHWVPQVVEIAGGINGRGSRAQPSKYRTAEEANILSGTNRCSSIEAVRSDEIYAVNANAYFSKPGIRTITGLDILAKIIDPIRFADLKFICKDRNMNKTNQTCHVYNSKSTWLTSTICKINTDIDYKKNVIAKIYK